MTSFPRLFDGHRCQDKDWEGMWHVLSQVLPPGGEETGGG